MQPTSIFPDIQIIRMADCIAHEGVVPRWVDQIAASIRDHGVMKNPIIVTRRIRGKYIVIDGMHRFAAFRQLEIPDIVAYVINYDAPTVQLEGWDALVFRPFKALPFLRSLGTRYLVKEVADLQTAQQALEDRHALIAATDRSQRCYLLTSRTTVTVDQLVRASEMVDRRIDTTQFKPVYVADSLATRDFHTTKANGLIIRPHYTKTEIIRRTLARHIFPRKSTRHLIPGRPLRVDVSLALLRARLSLAAKNRLLDEHLRWCYESDRVRYYPESVFIFAD